MHGNYGLRASLETHCLKHAEPLSSVRSFIRFPFRGSVVVVVVSGRPWEAAGPATVGWSLVLTLLLATWGGMLTGAEATRRTQLRAALLRRAAVQAKDHEPQMAEAMGSLETAAERRSVRSAFARSRKSSGKKTRASWAWRFSRARA